MDSVVKLERPALAEKTAGPDRSKPGGAFSTHAAFLIRLFAELDAQNICYCVLRNFENLPETMDGDVDILVRSGDLQKAEVILMALMEGLLLIRRVERNGHLQFYVASEDEIDCAVRESHAVEVVMLDFVAELGWKGIAYLDAEAVLSARQRHGNFYVPGPQHRVAHILCHAILE
ncbi:MAG: hypothetical protein ACE5GH_06610, partial [Fidelibacterota bacterium]